MSWENLPTPSGATAETWQVQVSGTNATNFDDPLSYDNSNYDSTGLTLSLAPGTYLVRVRAKSGEPHVNNSHFSEIVAFTVEDCSSCTYTQGYWKNHTDVWPVSALAIGSVVYTAAQLQDIFSEPVKGNGLISLAHQLIAAKLNIENGANGGVVATAIADADAMIGALVVPPVGSRFLVPSGTSGLGTILDSYNNGIIGPGHCD